MPIIAKFKTESEMTTKPVKTKNKIEIKTKRRVKIRKKTAMKSSSKLT